MTEDANDTKPQREGPAKRFAKEYMKTAQLPLTEEDLAHAFTLGIRYGKGSGWHRVGEQIPTPKHMNEQIVVVVGLTRNTYDLDVITCSEYNAYINNKNCIGVPLFWTYFRALFSDRVKVPKTTEDTEE